MVYRVAVYDRLRGAKFQDWSISVGDLAVLSWERLVGDFEKRPRIGIIQRRRIARRRQGRGNSLSSKSSKWAIFPTTAVIAPKHAMLDTADLHIRGVYLFILIRTELRLVYS